MPNSLLIIGMGAGCSAWVDLVALVVTEAGVISRAPRVASARGHAGVALAQGLRVLVVPLAAVHQVECRLDVGAADLHCRGIRVCNVLRCNAAALAKGTITSTGTEHWLVLNVDLLVVVQVQPLPLRRDAASCSR